MKTAEPPTDPTTVPPTAPAAAPPTPPTPPATTLAVAPAPEKGKKKEPPTDDVPFVARRYGKPEEKPKTPPTPPAVPAPADLNAGTPPPAAPKQPKRPVKHPAAPAAQLIDEEKLGKSIAAGLAPVLKPAATSPDLPKPTELSFSERQNVSILKKLEETRPEFKGRADKYITSLAAVEEYEEKWKTAHPDQDFDPADAEHKAFFDANGLGDIDEDVWAEAEEEYRTDKVEARLTPKVEKKLEPVVANQNLQNELPAIRQSQVDVGGMVLKALGDDFAKVQDANGTPDPKEIDRLLAENPLRTFALAGVQRAVNFTEQLGRLVRKLPALPEPVEPHLKSTHVTPDDVLKFADEQEALFETLPDVPLAEGGKLDKHGRTFMKAELFDKLKPEQQKRHWKFNELMLRKMYAAEQAALSTQEMAAQEKRVNQIATARGWTPKAAPTPPKPPITKSPPGVVAPIVAQPGASNGGANGSSKDSYIAGRYG